MPCPNCDHTMHALSAPGLKRPSWHWCPRCGTIQPAGEGLPEDVRTPDLVTEVRYANRSARHALPDTKQDFYALTSLSWANVCEAAGTTPREEKAT